MRAARYKSMHIIIGNTTGGQDLVFAAARCGKSRMQDFDAVLPFYLSHLNSDEALSRSSL